MTAPDIKEIVQRLEKVEKRNRRYKILNIIALFLLLVLMVTPQLSAISVPSLDPLWDSIRRIDDFIDFESDCNLVELKLNYHIKIGAGRGFIRYHNSGSIPDT